MEQIFQMILLCIYWKVLRKAKEKRTIFHALSDLVF